MRALILTTATMLAFAGNSLLCRAALAEARIGPVGFASVRLAAGALVLSLIVRWSAAASPSGARAPRWRSALALLAYALPFSVAYVWLDAGTGALILFAAVQLTMLGRGVIEGERPSARVWLGCGIAFSGLVALVWPGLRAPDPLGATLMTMAGVGWGAYSLLGRGSPTPLRTNALNFVRAAPPALAVLAIVMPIAPAESLSRWSLEGVGLAVISGGLTSGLGYALWYRALRRIDTVTAAVAQLSVPVIATAGGVAWLGETVTARMLVASGITLTGIAMVTIRGRGAKKETPSPAPPPTDEPSPEARAAS